jgi:hypothetical protein
MTKDQAIEAVKLPDQNRYAEIIAFAMSWVPRQRGTFSSEDLRAAYEKAGYPPSEEYRSMGPVFRKLKHLDLIEKAGGGTALNDQAHDRPINLWRTKIKHQQLPGVLIGGKQSKLF